jgi:hypothetical protein
MQIAIPELEQISKRLENIEKILVKKGSVESKVEVKKNINPWLMGPEIRHMFHCGPDRIKQMVAEGKLEVTQDFGRYPRYRVAQP